MLDSMTEENGTILLPASHREPLNPSVPGTQPLHEARCDEVRAVGPAGSVLFCDSRLWHCVPDNKGSSPRVAIAVRYAPWWFDTSVVMPGSAARRRIVDGPGAQQDSAGIPRAHCTFGEPLYASLLRPA